MKPGTLVRLHSERRNGKSSFMHVLPVEEGSLDFLEWYQNEVGIVLPPSPDQYPDYISVMIPGGIGTCLICEVREIQ